MGTLNESKNKKMFSEINDKLNQEVLKKARKGNFKKVISKTVEIGVKQEYDEACKRINEQDEQS